MCIRAGEDTNYLFLLKKNVVCDTYFPRDETLSKFNAAHEQEFSVIEPPYDKGIQRNFAVLIAAPANLIPYQDL